MINWNTAYKDLLKNVDTNIFDGLANFLEVFDRAKRSDGVKLQQITNAAKNTINYLYDNKEHLEEMVFNVGNVSSLRQKTLASVFTHFLFSEDWQIKKKINELIFSDNYITSLRDVIFINSSPILTGSFIKLFNSNEKIMESVFNEFLVKFTSDTEKNFSDIDSYINKSVDAVKLKVLSEGLKNLNHKDFFQFENKTRIENKILSTISIQDTREFQKSDEMKLILIEYTKLITQNNTKKLTYQDMDIIFNNFPFLKDNGNSGDFKLIRDYINIPELTKDIENIFKNQPSFNDLQYKDIKLDKISLFQTYMLNELLLYDKDVIAQQIKKYKNNIVDIEANIKKQTSSNLKLITELIKLDIVEIGNINLKNIPKDFRFNKQFFKDVGEELSMLNRSNYWDWGDVSNDDISSKDLIISNQDILEEEFENNLYDYIQHSYKLNKEILKDMVFAVGEDRTLDLMNNILIGIDDEKCFNLKKEVYKELSYTKIQKNESYVLNGKKSHPNQQDKIKELFHLIEEIMYMENYEERLNETQTKLIKLEQVTKDGLLINVIESFHKKPLFVKCIADTRMRESEILCKVIQKYIKEDLKNNTEENIKKTFAILTYNEIFKNFFAIKIKNSTFLDLISELCKLCVNNNGKNNVSFETVQKIVKISDVDLFDIFISKNPNLLENKNKEEKDMFFNIISLQSFSKISSNNKNIIKDIIVAEYNEVFNKYFLEKQTHLSEGLDETYQQLLKLIKVTHLLQENQRENIVPLITARKSKKENYEIFSFLWDLWNEVEKPFGAKSLKDIYDTLESFKESNVFENDNEILKFLIDRELVSLNKNNSTTKLSDSFRDNLKYMEAWSDEALILKVVDLMSKMDRANDLIPTFPEEIGKVMRLICNEEKSTWTSKMRELIVRQKMESTGTKISHAKKKI